MKELIKDILRKIGCNHHWELYHRTKVYETISGQILPYEIEDILMCKKCGKIKKIKL